MASAVVAVPQAHWFNGWFLRLFARPVVRVDGEERAGNWGRATEVQVEPGPHLVAVGARYHGTRALLGAAETRVDVPPDQRVTVEARNGFFNHQPFKVTGRV